MGSAVNVSLKETVISRSQTCVVVGNVYKHGSERYCSRVPLAVWIKAVCRRQEKFS